MIDIENQLVELLTEAIKEEYPDAYIINEYETKITRFPSISIEEIDNTSHMITTSSKEDFASVVYEINIYSNRKTDKKQQCKNIADIIDKRLYPLNFTRTMMQSVKNYKDSSIYRIVVRYRAVVSRYGMIYRR